MCVLDINLALVPETEGWAEFKQHISQLKHSMHPRYLKQHRGPVIYSCLFIFPSSQLMVQKFRVSVCSKNIKEVVRNLNMKSKELERMRTQEGTHAEVLQWTVSQGHFLFHRPMGQNGAAGATARAGTTAPPGAKQQYRQTQT